MKAFLMHRDHDVDLDSELPPAAEAVTQDLRTHRPAGGRAHP